MVGVLFVQSVYLYTIVQKPKAVVFNLFLVQTATKFKLLLVCMWILLCDSFCVQNIWIAVSNTQIRWSSPWDTFFLTLVSQWKLYPNLGHDLESYARRVLRLDGVLYRIVSFRFASDSLAKIFLLTLCDSRLLLFAAVFAVANQASLSGTEAR